MPGRHPIAHSSAGWLLAATLLCAGTLPYAGTLAAQDPATREEAAEPAPPLTIEAVRIEPAAPGADTLCRLFVTLASSAERPVSALDFGVAIGDTALAVYEKQLFLEHLAPGAKAEIRLYNFWTSETGRPAPADGKLRVTVTLRGAQWVEITTEDDGTEVWTLGEAVPGLPIAKELVVPLGK